MSFLRNFALTASAFALVACSGTSDANSVKVNFNDDGTFTGTSPAQYSQESIIDALGWGGPCSYPGNELTGYSQTTENGITTFSGKCA